MNRCPNCENVTYPNPTRCIFCGKETVPAPPGVSTMTDAQAYARDRHIREMKEAT